MDIDYASHAFVQDHLAVNREPVVYLSGAVSALSLNHPYIGVMLQPGMGNRPDLSKVAWACDNGCFALGDRFDGDKFLRHIEQPYFLQYHKTCRFVVAPDTVGNAEATLRKAVYWLPRLRETGYPVAFVGQDGLDYRAVPWSGFDVFFVGGSTEWKLGADARYLMAEARARGKKVHVGRVNSLKRMTLSAVRGAHTYDGTYLAFGPQKNAPRLRRWAEELAYHERPAR